MSQLLITVLIGVCTYLWFSRFRHVASWRKGARTLRDCAFDLAELDLPDGWRAGHNLNDSAGIEAVDLRHSRYSMVLSESLDDYDASLTFETYAGNVRDVLTSDLRHVQTSQPERLSINGSEALRWEIDGVYELTRIRYLFTVVMGRRALHQIVSWSPRSAYSRTAFEELARGFRERPGAPAQRRVDTALSPATERPRVIGFR